MISLRNNFSWPLWYNNALRNRKRNKERKDPIWFGVYRMCVYQPGDQIYNSSLKEVIYSHALHEVNSCHLWRLGAGNKQVLHFPLLYPTGFLESLCFSEACWQSAILWKTLGKSFSARKADARFNKSLTISSWGSPLRVRMEWLPLNNNKFF